MDHTTSTIDSLISETLAALAIDSMIAETLAAFDVPVASDCRGDATVVRSRPAIGAFPLVDARIDLADPIDFLFFVTDDATCA